MELDTPEADGPGDALDVEDQLTGARYRWGRDNYVRLDPHNQPAHIFLGRRGLR